MRQEEIIAHIKAYQYSRTITKRWRELTTHPIDPANVKHLALVVVNARLLIRVYRELRDLLNIKSSTWDSTNLENIYWHANPQLYEKQLAIEEQQLHKELKTIESLYAKRTTPLDQRPHIQEIRPPEPPKEYEIIQTIQFLPDLA